MPDNRAVFSVDTHLFRELGDLLVGRDSTALFELIKNSYDADASEVTVVGSALDDPEAGQVSIIDNGSGMDEETFRLGFLRIASRVKDEGDRRSKTFQRRFTGAKGIGRLAAHKLSRLLQIESYHGVPGNRAAGGIRSIIDWDGIERLATLDEIESGRQVIITPLIAGSRSSTGTRVTLQKLRRRWTPEERHRFVAECRSFRPPAELTGDLVPQVLHERLLFDTLRFQDRQPNDPGFTLNLEGELATGESLWPVIAATSQWIIEVDASLPTDGSEPCIRFGIGPSNQMSLQHPHWQRRFFATPHPRSTKGPFFQARVFVQIDPKASPTGRRKIRSESGIRVFVEGFRILPYGEPGNDWLSLDANYARRSNLDFGEGVDKLFGPSEADEHWQNLHLPNRSYFGGVFVTQDSSTGLRPLINREGFLPEAAFDFLRDTIRQAIDLATRVRAAATDYERKVAREAKRAKRAEQGPSHETTPQDTGKYSLSGSGAPSSELEPLPQAVDHATKQLQQARDLLVRGKVEDANAILKEFPQRIDSIRDATERITEEGPMIRVLASLGTQMAAFVHEIRSLLATARAVEESSERLVKKGNALPQSLRSQLGIIASSVGDLRRHLERHASFLIDIVTPDASRRRSRQKLAERFASGIRLLQFAAERKNITINNAIPLALKTPPMFPAELTSVFSNLISNAIKAARSGGRIEATAHEDGPKLVVRIENTGERVDLADAEHWFRPFESTTAQVDSDLGQGMGLGLTITRSMLEPYGATICFVEPSPGFSTAIEIVFHERRVI